MKFLLLTLFLKASAMLIDLTNPKWRKTGPGKKSANLPRGKKKSGSLRECGEESFSSLNLHLCYLQQDEFSRNIWRMGGNLWTPLNIKPLLATWQHLSECMTESCQNSGLNCTSRYHPQCKGAIFYSQLQRPRPKHNQMKKKDLCHLDWEVLWMFRFFYSLVQYCPCPSVSPGPVKNQQCGGFR